MWLRADGRLPDDPLLHVCVLTFASDMTLLDAALARQGLANKLGGESSMASLDHAMWFERPFRADEWLLYTMQSPSAIGRPRRSPAGASTAGRHAWWRASCRKGWCGCAS